MIKPIKSWVIIFSGQLFECDAICDKHHHGLSCGPFNNLVTEILLPSLNWKFRYSHIKPKTLRNSINLMLSVGKAGTEIRVNGKCPVAHGTRYLINNPPHPHPHTPPPSSPPPAITKCVPMYSRLTFENDLQWITEKLLQATFSTAVV